MRTSGRANIAIVIAGAFIVALGAMTMFTEPTATDVASRFMAAMAKLDASTLADLSYVEGEDKGRVLEQWTYMTDVVAKEYTFSYEIKGEKSLSDKSSIVWMMFTKHAGMDGAFEERFELPMIKTDEGWKVDILATSRDFLPGMPR